MTFDTSLLKYGMKSQQSSLDVLSTVAVKQYPEEDVRRALGERIGLTEQQVQARLLSSRS